MEPPPGAQVFAIAAHSIVNGVPLRIIGFVCGQSVEQTLAWFKTKLGDNVSLSQVGAREILGRPSGLDYLTVELEPAAGGGTRGTVALADWPQAQAGARRYHDQIRRLQEVFGDRAQVLQHSESVDGAKHSRYIVLSNDQSARLNMSEARRWLEGQGLRLERSLESVAPDAENSPGSTGAAPTVTSFFRGRGKQAMAVATQNPQLGGVIVINVVEAAP